MKSTLKRYLTSFSLFFSLLVNATTTLTGTIENYAGQTLTLHYINNFITQETSIVATSLVDSLGHFLFSFESPIQRTYYINLGTRQAQLTLQPEQTLSIELPQYQALRQADLLNPYFQKDNVLIYNEHIKDDNYYQTEIEIQSTIWLQKTLESTTPNYTAKQALDSLATWGKALQTPYLQSYLHYSSTLFYAMAHQENTAAIKQHYLQKAEPELQNTAFTALFSSEYNNPFLAPDGLFIPLVSQAIVEEKLDSTFIPALAKSLKIKHRNMAELLAIKGCFDAAKYAPSYDETIAHLMTDLETYITDSTLQELCNTTRQYIEHLMVGQPAPYYELYTLQGKKVPTVIKRKVVLLAFINTNIFSCQKQLRLLEKFKAQYKRQLEVVVVAVYQDHNELDRFLKRNDFKDLYFTLWENNQDIITDYRIQSLPQYYLIDSDGFLIYSPMSSPEEDMMEELITIFE